MRSQCLRIHNAQSSAHAIKVTIELTTLCSGQVSLLIVIVMVTCQFLCPTQNLSPLPQIAAEVTDTQISNQGLTLAVTQAHITNKGLALDAVTAEADAHQAQTYAPAAGMGSLDRMVEHHTAADSSLLKAAQPGNADKVLDVTQAHISNKGLALDVTANQISNTGLMHDVTETQISSKSLAPTVTEHQTNINRLEFDDTAVMMSY